MKTQKDSKKQYAKVVLIISCVFAVIASVLLVIMVCDLPQVLEGRRKAKYLYENGIEVDAYIKNYYWNGRSLGSSTTSHFRIVYEYVDDNNRTYQDEYMDTVAFRTKVERDEREQYIKKMIADGTTKKMLIADNGLCCLSAYKESLIGYKSLALSITVISVSSVVLGLCIFGIVRQAKTLRRLR